MKNRKYVSPEFEQCSFSKLDLMSSSGGLELFDSTAEGVGDRVKWR